MEVQVTTIDRNMRAISLRSKLSYVSVEYKRSSNSNPVPHHYIDVKYRNSRIVIGVRRVGSKDIVMMGQL